MKWIDCLNLGETGVDQVSPAFLTTVNWGVEKAYLATGEGWRLNQWSQVLVGVLHPFCFLDIQHIHASRLPSWYLIVSGYSGYLQNFYKSEPCDSYGHSYCEERTTGTCSKPYCWCFRNLANQLIYSISYGFAKVLYIQTVVGLGMSEPSTAISKFFSSPLQISPSQNLDGWTINLVKL